MADKFVRLEDLQALCDNQKDHSITPNDFQRMRHYEFGWHTGKPTEEGDYLVKLDVEHHVYPYYVLKWNKGGWYSHYDMDYPACPQHSVLKWQKIEED